MLDQHPCEYDVAAIYTHQPLEHLYTCLFIQSRGSSVMQKIMQTEVNAQLGH